MVKRSMENGTDPTNPTMKTDNSKKIQPTKMVKKMDHSNSTMKTDNSKKHQPTKMVNKMDHSNLETSLPTLQESPKIASKQVQKSFKRASKNRQEPQKSPKEASKEPQKLSSLVEQRGKEEQERQDD